MTRDLAFRPLPIAIDEAALQEFSDRWGVAELELFGSVLRDDFRRDSDIDLLVTFRESRRPTLLTLVEMEIELR